jgi:two-component system, NarL family, sensor histidine kinase UhpB
VWAGRRVDGGAQCARELTARAGGRELLGAERELGRAGRPGAFGQPVELGLASALNALATRLTRQSGVFVDRHLDFDVPALGDDAEVVVYRVAQEAVTNVARHADATRVIVELACADGVVTLNIDDDGRGIPRHVGHEARGITGMRERALLLHGRLRVGRAWTQGTHRASILDKLGMRDLVELTRYAIRRGLVQP